HVSAKDLGTGKEQNIKITGSTNLSKDEINRMKEEAQRNEAEDNKRKEKIEAENNADAVVYQTKKVMDEYGDKVDVDLKKKIEDKIKEVEESRKAGEPAEINKKIEELNKSVQEIGTKIYQDAAAKQASSGKDKKGNENSEEDADGGKDGDENIVDADFKE
ncbi:MAG: Hsp70 family protein, partial [Nanoarchaeota archaeon]